jgi:hypothetical protein
VIPSLLWTNHIITKALLLSEPHSLPRILLSPSSHPSDLCGPVDLHLVSSLPISNISRSYIRPFLSIRLTPPSHPPLPSPSLSPSLPIPSPLCRIPTRYLHTPPLHANMFHGCPRL